MTAPGEGEPLALARRSGYWPGPVAALDAALVLCIGELLLLVGTKNLTFGSSTGGWEFNYIGDFQLRPLLTGVALSVALVPLVHLSLRLVERYQFAVLALSMVLGLAGQLVLRSLYGYSLADIVGSEPANAYYGVSLKFRAYDLLSRYNDLGPSLPLHAKANMPGKVLLYHGLELITHNPRSLAILIIVISNLGGVLLYFIVSTLYGNRAVALSALMLYLFIPARVYFMPLLNVVTPVPVLGCLLLLSAFLASGRRSLALLVGAGLYAVLFFDPLPLSLGLFFVALAARSWWSGEVSVSDLLWLVGLTEGSLVVIYLVFRFGLHFDAIRRFMSVTAVLRDFFGTQGRPYWLWVRANLVEFSLGAGVLPSVLCLLYLVTCVVGAIGRMPTRAEEFFSSLLSPGPLMLVTLLATLGALDLLGLNRGEVLRLWIFLMTFVQVVAAHFCCEKAGRWTLDIVLAGSIIQTAVTISMVGFII